MAYGRGVLSGIAKYSRVHGPWMFYSEPGGKEASLPEFKNWGVDGIIAHVTSKKEAQEILSAGKPVVFKGLEIEGSCCVVSNCEAIGKIGAEYLLNKGFKNFAFCGYRGNLWSKARAQSFSNRIAKAGFETYFYEKYNKNANLTWETEGAILADWIRLLPKPVAVMSCHDVRARHVIEACRLANCDVPNEVAVLGVDNDEVFCDLSNPALSSIELNLESAGYRAAELLAKLMAGKEIKENRVMVEPRRVLTRRSTEGTAVEDKCVVEALIFIKEHAKENMQVSDVLNAVAISRTALQKRFHKAIGASIYDEIRRIRVEQIVRMLLETDMSVSQIAFNLGFTSIKHISRYFRKQKGMNLSEYRRLHKI